MFGSAILDVAIGLFLMYLLLSMIATVVQEAIANLLNLRSANLYKGLTALLEDDAFPGLVEDLYKHPLVFRFIDGEYKRSRWLFGLVTRDNGPSYIPSDTFIAALVDTLRHRVLKETEPLGFNALMASSRRVADALPQGPLKTNLMLLVGDETAAAAPAGVEGAAATGLAHGLAEVRQVRKRLEQWFDESMDRVAGVYRRLSQVIAIAIGIIAAVALNADSIHVAVRLWQDAPLRSAIADSAAPLLETLAAEKAGGDVRPALQGKLDQLQVFPIGWSQGGNGQNFVYAAAGWLLTGFAVSLGSSFWFNALGELLKLRAAGPRVQTSTSSPPGDRQSAPGA